MKETLFSLDKKGCFEMLSGPMPIFGCDQKELLGKPLADFLKPKSRKEFRKHEEESQKTPLTNLLEMEIKKNDGSTATAELNISSQFKNNEFMGWLGVIRDTSKREQRWQDLRLSEEKYRALVESSPDGIITANKTGKVLSVNQAFSDLTGFKKSDFVGKHFLKLPTLIKQDMSYYARIVKDVLQRKKLDLIQFKWKHANGEIRDGEFKASLIKQKNKIVGLQAIVRDVTERERAKKQVQRDLEEKTMLLREIHHRVKNSLQVVCSLLRLQSHEIKDKNTLDMFRQSINRIYMMSAVYEKLYQTKNFANIDYKEYLEDVLENIYQSSDVVDRVSLKLDIKDVVLGLDDATPVSLIINELFTNSIKHAFPGERKGEIQISFEQLDDGTYQLIFRDNGVGLPEDVDFESAEGLGLNLIKNLAQQIEGTAALEQNDWTTFKILFKGYGSAKNR